MKTKQFYRAVSALCFCLLGCGGTEVGASRPASETSKSLAQPTLGGASASGGDVRPKVPPFEFGCELRYSEPSGTALPVAFNVNEANYRDSHETPAYDVKFMPAWRDYPTPGNILTIHLVVKAPGGSLTKNISRSSAVYPLDQKEISTWIYNDQEESGTPSTKRSLALECKRK